MTKMFIEDEVGILKTAAVFPPGLEAYLAQFWPEKDSLFFGKFDIEKAQLEHSGLVKILENFGVKVFDLREAYASTLAEPSLSAERLINGLIQKVPQAERKILEKLLEEETRAYGERAAVALNIALSYNPQIPIGNLYFARDQSNVVLDTCILGNMKAPIRKPEVKIVKKALEALGYNSFYNIQNGTFEGGDCMIINGKAYIGAGSRTSLEAVREIAEHIDIPVLMVQIPDNGGRKKNMEIMHLDTFLMPLTERTVLGCWAYLKACTAYDLTTGRSMNFFDYLMNNFKVLNTPKREQKSYSANMLVVEPGKVIIPSDYNYRTTATLQKLGIGIINAGLKELTQGFGATHCMVLQLEKYRR